LGSHGRKTRQSVSAIDVNHHCEWPEAMRRIEVTISVQVVIGTPPCFAERLVAIFNTGMVRCNAIVEQHTAQIMLIPSAQVKQLTKQALLYHVEYRHDITPVTNIFEWHYRNACLSRGVYIIPAVL